MHKSGEVLTFRRRLVEIHGEEVVQMLETKKHMQVRYSLLEYDALYHHYKDEVHKIVLRETK